MLSSPHSPPAPAAWDSLASVASSMDPPPQAESAKVATAASAPSRAPRLLAILMMLLLISGLFEKFGGLPGRPDGQPHAEGPAWARPVVAADVRGGAGDPVEHHAEQHDGEA